MTSAILETKAKKMDDYIETFSGAQFRVSKPAMADMRILDIVHALSCINRYLGHAKFPYSVAQHSILLHDYVKDTVLDKPNMKQNLRLALLHDAPEAFIAGDVPKPNKVYFPEVSQYEDKLWRDVIAPKFKVPSVIPEWFKELDFRIVGDERTHVMCTSHNKWAADHVRPLGITISERHWRAVKSAWLRRWFEVVV
jgi:hypothetical protein